MNFNNFEYEDSSESSNFIVNDYVHIELEPKKVEQVITVPEFEEIKEENTRDIIIEETPVERKMIDRFPSIDDHPVFYAVFEIIKKHIKSLEQNKEYKSLDEIQITLSTFTNEETIEQQEVSLLLGKLSSLLGFIIGDAIGAQMLNYDGDDFKQDCAEALKLDYVGMKTPVFRGQTTDMTGINFALSNALSSTQNNLVVDFNSIVDHIDRWCKDSDHYRVDIQRSIQITTNKDIKEKAEYAYGFAKYLNYESKDARCLSPIPYLVLSSLNASKTDFIKLIVHTTSLIHTNKSVIIACLSYAIALRELIITQNPHQAFYTAFQYVIEEEDKYILEKEELFYVRTDNTYAFKCFQTALDLVNADGSINTEAIKQLTKNYGREARTNSDDSKSVEWAIVLSLLPLIAKLQYKEYIHILLSFKKISNITTSAGLAIYCAYYGITSFDYDVIEKVISMDYTLFNQRMKYVFRGKKQSDEYSIHNQIIKMTQKLLEQPKSITFHSQQVKGIVSARIMEKLSARFASRIKKQNLKNIERAVKPTLKTLNYRPNFLDECDEIREAPKNKYHYNANTEKMCPNKKPNKFYMLITENKEGQIALSDKKPEKLRYYKYNRILSEELSNEFLLLFYKDYVLKEKKEIPGDINGVVKKIILWNDVKACLKKIKADENFEHYTEFKDKIKHTIKEIKEGRTKQNDQTLELLVRSVIEEFSELAKLLDLRKLRKYQILIDSHLMKIIYS